MGLYAYKSLTFKESKSLNVSIFLAEGNCITSLERKQSHVTDVTSFFSLHSTFDNLRKECTLKGIFFPLGI